MKKMLNLAGVVALSTLAGLGSVAHADGGPPFGGDNDCDNVADINADGVLDVQDILAFINAVLNDDPAADVDGSGAFDLLDVQLFIESFLAGCP